MYSKEEVTAALSKVKYPGNEDIVSLGMVDKIEIDANGIKIVLRSEKRKDPVLSSIKHACVQAVKDALGPEAVVTSVEVVSNEPATELPPKVNDIMPGVKNIIAVASGKGGVGKSTVSANIAISLSKKGYATGLLDADIFGPSIPKMINAEKFKPAVRNENGNDYIIPLEKYGIKVLSVGFFVDPSNAVVWRGPLASNFLKQMLSQGDWGELDYLIIDLPPGTSDIHLTLVQEVSVTGAVIVSTPQEVALADAVKGISMFRTDKINVPVLGLIENMSWFSPAELPENRYYIFGRDGGKKLASKFNIPLLGQIPLVQGICESGDSGEPVALKDSILAKAFDELSDQLVESVKKRNSTIAPTTKVAMK